MEIPPISEKQKNHLEKLHKINKGRKNTEEVRKRMSQSQRIRFKDGMPKEHRRKISNALKGNKNGLGYKHTDEAKKKISEKSKGNKYSLGCIPWNKDKKLPEMSGENHPNWKGENCKKRQKRNDSAYSNWVRQVKKRDKNICRINKDCSGYCEVHHILSWKDYQELRYEINNGITLCQAHHPLKRAEEKRLIPFFQGLVSVSSE